MSSTILFVEDDPNLGYILSEYLAFHGFALTWVKDGKEALPLLSRQRFHLCIIDVMLPHMDGFTLAAGIRQSHPDIPFIFLTARSLKIDKLKGFKLGADDYITKPVDEEELVARIHAVLKRMGSAAPPAEDLHFGQSCFNRHTQSLVTRGAGKQLTNKEAAVLQLLAMNKNRIAERDHMLKTIWGANDFFNRRSMDVIISRLRKLLQEDPTVIIKNVHGKGYILEEVQASKGESDGLPNPANQ